MAGLNVSGPTDGSVHFKNGPWWEWIYTNSYITRLIVNNVLHLTFFFTTPAIEVKEKAQAIDEIGRCLDKFQALCNQNEMRCIFVFQTGFSDFKAGTADCDPIRTYAANKHYEVIDIFDFFRKNGVNAQNTASYFWPIDLHNNNWGYALYAKALKEKL